MTPEQIEQLASIIEAIKNLKTEVDVLSLTSKEWLDEAIRCLEKAKSYEEF